MLKSQTKYFNNYTAVFICLLLSTLSARTQHISVHHPQIKFIFEDSLLQNQYYHSAILPFKVSVKKLTTHFNPRDSKPSKNFFISPVIDAVGGYQSHTKDFFYRLGQGGFVAANLGRDAGLELSAVLYEQKFPGQSYPIDSLQLVPRNNNYIWGKNEQAGYVSIRGKIYWKALRWLTFTAGNDKHFIGDGERSVLLSENATAYPFFQTRLNVWKVNYMHQVMFMDDVVPGIKSKRFDKYASMHVISLNATKRINFYVSEAVVWRKQDSVRHRGFDVHYLNPFLFYRPVEFNMGSPDNVFMGIGGKLILGKHSALYGQFMLDEFKLKEIKAQKGWWASKYALQAGFKTYSLFRNHRSLFLAEYNHARPFTYAHTNSLQNYGYLNQPLAHPQGSNFREFLSVFRIEFNKWLITASARYINYGTDPTGKNYGSDIYKGQYTHSREYGNTTGQGIPNRLAGGEVTIGRMLVPAWRMAAFTEINMNLHSLAGTKTWETMFRIGINTLLYE